MKKLRFTETIQAPKEAVWRTLWSDESYRQWTKAFSEGSYAETDNWKQGTEVRFLDPSGCGMLSRVAENRPNEFMSFEHLGEVRNGVEDRDSEVVKSWAGARENYTLTEKEGRTELLIEMDSNEQYADMFNNMWPKAMKAIKTLSENNR